MAKMFLQPLSRLDTDQSAALRTFVQDLNNVLTAANVSPEYHKRSLEGLAAAYHAALLTGKWDVLVAILADTLDDLEDGGRAAKTWSSSSYWRLYSIVWENDDLLPPEMRKISC